MVFKSLRGNMQAAQIRRENNNLPLHNCKSKSNEFVEWIGGPASSMPWNGRGAFVDGKGDLSVG
jgi:hypothetical protein